MRSIGPAVTREQSPGAHVSRKLFPGPYPRRPRAGTDRTGRPVEHGAVSAGAARELVTLHDAGKPLSFAYTAYGNPLAFFKYFRRHDLALLKCAGAKFTEKPVRLHIRLLKMSGNGLRHPALLFFFIKGKLNGLVAVPFHGLFLHHRARACLDDGDRDKFPAAEMLTHAYLFADNSLAHLESPHPRSRRGRFHEPTA